MPKVFDFGKGFESFKINVTGGEVKIAADMLFEPNDWYLLPDDKPDKTTAIAAMREYAARFRVDRELFEDDVYGQINVSVGRGEVWVDDKKTVEFDVPLIEGPKIEDAPGKRKIVL